VDGFLKLNIFLTRAFFIVELRMAFHTLEGV
jgi:hypothetical protein